MVAATDVGVLLLGEPGSGRASLARRDSRLRPALQRPLISFVCAGAPEGALASRVKAVTLRGPEAAATLYLDEVGELCPRIRRVSCTSWLPRTPPPKRPAGHRRLCQDLGIAVKEGRFRRDLYLRLCVVPLSYRRCASVCSTLRRSVPTSQGRPPHVTICARQHFLWDRASVPRYPGRATCGACEPVRAPGDPLPGCSGVLRTPQN